MDKENLKTIDTRFGNLNIDISKKIYFPHGVIGFEKSKNFVITNFPRNDDMNFKIMQSLDEKEISFIVMAYDIKQELIEFNDIEKSADLFKIPIDDILILFVVSIYNQDGNNKIAINLRAPILINTEFNLATQYVFVNNKYPIRYEIN